jgi:hypothetical protein
LQAPGIFGHGAVQLIGLVLVTAFCHSGTAMNTLSFSLFSLLLSSAALFSQAPAPAPSPAAPAAPTAPAVTVPFSPQEQAFARTASTYLQNLMQVTLAGRRAKATDPDIADFATKMNRGLVSRWTPFVNVCQAHKFHQIATDVSKNTAESIAKMSKLKGADHRTEFFKLALPEAQRALAYVQSFVPQIRNAELKKNAESIAATLKTTAEALAAKSKEPFTPQAAAKPDPKKKK